MKITGILWLLLFPLASMAQKPLRPQPDSNIIRAAFHLLDSTFHTSSISFELNELNPPPDILEIMIKFNNAMAANRDWAIDYMNKYYKPGAGVPYDPRMGITIEEYNKIRYLDQSRYKLVKQKTEKIDLTRKDSIISFQGEDNFHLLDYLQIDLAHKKLIYSGETVPFSEQVDTPAPSALGTWHGYVWEFDQQQPATSQKTDQLTGKNIKVQIGITTPGKQTFIRILFALVEQGESKANMDLIGFITP